MTQSSENVPIEVSVPEVKQRMDNEAPIFLVDCREPVEHSICQIEGAVLIPMNETPARLEELKAKPERIVVF